MTANGTKTGGPQFVRYFEPVLKALHELGGSARPSEVEAHIAANLSVSVEQQNEVTKSGQSRFRNQIGWAKFYLSKAGYIESSQHGVWNITPNGTSIKLTHEAAIKLFKNIHNQLTTIGNQQKPTNDESGDIAADDLGEPLKNYKEALVDALLKLPPAGFERLSQRLLREAGFEEVTVTGKSGDGGIDGHGLLQINPFVSFQVLFQCKRYEGSVTPEQVRAFRGAMDGRSDKGIIITTGTFSVKAREEATRQGALPIELVDRDKLISMFERLELGLIPVKTYEVDLAFFNEFKK